MSTACETTYDCGRRQVCHLGHCQCLTAYGLTGMPDCHEWSAGAYYTAALLVAVTVAQLCLAYIHGVTLYNHLRDGNTSPYKSEMPSIKSEPEAREAPNESSWEQRFKHRLVMLTTRKSLFCLTSILWLLVTIINRVCIGIIMLADGSVGPLFAYPTSIFEFVFSIGFVFFAWSYLIIGRIWLDVAGKFGGPCIKRFNNSCVSRLVFMFFAVLLILPSINYLRAPTEATRMVVKLWTIGTMGLFCTACFAFGAAVIVRVIRMRAKQVKDHPPDRKPRKKRSKPRMPHMQFRQFGAQVPHSKEQEERQKRMVLHVLKRARNRAFQPMLSHVSEADSSAVERSAAKSVMGRSGRINLDDSAEGGEGFGSASWRREGHRHKPESPDAANFRRVDRLAGEVNAKVASPTENLQEDTRHREAVNYSTLSWHIASTALKVGASFALTLGLTAAEACIIAARPDMGNMAAVGYLFMRILAYPLVHFWSNLACLQIISKEARGITNSVSTVVWAPLRFLWYLLCTCGVDDESAEDDYDEDELGMGGVAEEEE